MDKSGIFPMAAAQQVATQIGQHIGLMDIRPKPNSINLGYTFKVWKISPKFDAANFSALNFRQALSKTDYYHHQILFDNSPKAYARTIQKWDSLGNKVWHFRELAISPLSAYIEQGRMAMANATEGYVSLTILPKFHLTTLWSHESKAKNDYICIVDSPSNSSFSRFEFFGTQDFFARLASEEFVIGIEDQ